MAKKAAKKQVMVWHITHYDDLFRAVDTGGHMIKTVKYAQDIMTGSDELSKQHLMRMEVMEAELGFDGFVIAKHLFMQLLKHSHKFSGALINYRGYILDECQRPPGPAKIATLLRCPANAVKSYLKVLARLGLIERVPLPDQPDQSAPKPTKKKKTTAKKTKPATGKKKTGTAKKTVKKTTQQLKDQELIACSELFGRTTKSLQESANGNVKSKPRPSASVETKRENKVGLSASKGAAASATSRPVDPDGQAEGPAVAGPMPKGKAERQGQADTQGTPQMAGTTKTPHSPTASPPMMPMMPTETDGRSGIGFCLETESVNGISLVSLYDRTGRAFGEEIYRAILTPHALDTPAAAREVGVFAAAWQRACRSGLPPSVMVRLRDKAIAHAAQLGKKRTRSPDAFSKSPEAVWVMKFKKLLAGMQQDQAGLENVKQCKAKV